LAQCQTYNLNFYLPLHSTYSWDADVYGCRSAATAGFCGEWDILAPQFPLAKERACIREITDNRPYWTGDYYPLTPWTIDADRWMAWQLHRADLDAGIVLAFRHKDSPYSTLQVEMHGLKLTQEYRVQFIDDQHHVVNKNLTGRDLCASELRIPARHASLLIRYAPRHGPGNDR
jgi:alpha-galactosidase